MDSVPAATAADTETRCAPTSGVERVPVMNRQMLLHAADILDEAHDVLLVRGWRGMGKQFVPAEALCVEAAIVHVVTGREVCGFQTFRNNGGKEPCLIPVWLEHELFMRGINFIWNDFPERTEDEIFAKLRTVAKSFREEAGGV